MYDNKNRLKELKTEDSLIKYQYDKQGNILEELNYTTNDDTYEKTTFSYDGFNRNIVVTNCDDIQQNIYDPDEL